MKGDVAAKTHYITGYKCRSFVGSSPGPGLWTGNASIVLPAAYGDFLADAKLSVPEPILYLPPPALLAAPRCRRHAFHLSSEFVRSPSYEPEAKLTFF